MSVDNIFSSKISEMYHNEQLCMTHSGNVISIKNVLKFISLMKEHNKKAKYVDISILLWFYLPPSPRDFCVGLGVQATKDLYWDLLCLARGH